MIIASVSGGGNNADTGYWVDPDSCCFDISKFIDLTTTTYKE